MGVLKWAPSEFWQSTMHDLAAALDGHLETVGRRKGAPEALTMAEMEDLMRRFPDAPN